MLSFDDISNSINKEILISDTNEIIEKRLNIRNNISTYLKMDAFDLMSDYEDDQPLSTTLNPVNQVEI